LLIWLPRITESKDWKSRTIVLEITTRITIAQRIPGFWVCSKNQRTLKNGEEDEEFDEVTLGQAIARVVVGVLKPGPEKRYCKRV